MAESQVLPVLQACVCCLWTVAAYVSSLMILQQLMATVDPESPPKPCDYFDMIGGTSTGSLIAIMLGRLQMTVDECINAYTSLSDKVFEQKAHGVKISGKLQGRFDSAEPERAVKRIMLDRGLNQDTLLKDSADAPCKVFVSTTSKQTGDTVYLTSYRSPRVGTHLFDSTKIWQACRATSAATTFFDPIIVGPFDEEFVDGALGANNPINTLWNQAQDVWGDQLWARLRCLVYRDGSARPDASSRRCPQNIVHLKRAGNRDRKDS